MNKIAREWRPPKLTRSKTCLSIISPFVKSSAELSKTKRIIHTTRQELKDDDVNYIDIELRFYGWKASYFTIGYKISETIINKINVSLNKFLYEVAECGWLTVALDGFFRECIRLYDEGIVSIKNHYLPYMIAYDDMLLNTAILQLEHVLLIKLYRKSNENKNILKNVKIVKNIGKSVKMVDITDF